MPGRNGTAALLGRERSRPSCTTPSARPQGRAAGRRRRRGCRGREDHAGRGPGSPSGGARVHRRGGALSRHRGGHLVRAGGRGGGRAGRRGSRTSSPDRSRGGCAPCSTRRRPASAEHFHLLEDLRLTVLEAAARAGAAGAGGHALGRPLDPGLRGGALAARRAGGCCSCSRSVATTCIVDTRPGRRSPRSAVSRVPGVWTSARWTGQHRRHRGSGHGDGPPTGAGALRAGALGGQPALRRGARWPPVRARSPSQLSDLFLARVDALAEGPRELLRVASVDGTRVDTDTLAELAQARPGAAGRRPPRRCSTRTSCGGAGDSLAFRHGLLREAVYDDLLPDERTRLHAELAAILQARVDEDPEPRLSVLSRLAFHWSAAHDLPRTLRGVGASRRRWRGGSARPSRSPTSSERCRCGTACRTRKPWWAGRRSSSSCRLARSACDQGDVSAGTRSTAGPSRCWSPTPTRWWRAGPTPPSAFSAIFNDDLPARRRRSASPSSTPATRRREERAYALGRPGAAAPRPRPVRGRTGGCGSSDRGRQGRRRHGSPAPGPDVQVRGAAAPGPSERGM